MPAQARLAVIGTGWWSTYTHIPGLIEHPDVELVALCDSDGDRLRAAGDAYNVERRYTSVASMLEHERLDGVVVATNHASHFEIARDCLEHDLHVMVEKPMTLRARDARRLVELAAERSRALIVGYPFNYSPLALRAREIVASGALGAIQLVTCAYGTRVVNLYRGDDRSSVARYPVHGPGAVYSQPSLSGGGQGHLQVTHAGGLLFWVCGLRPIGVQARMRSHGLPVDLVDAMIVELDGGALATIGSTGNTYLHRLDLLVHCENGGLALDMVGDTLTVRGAVEETHGKPDDDPGYRRFAPLYQLVDVVLGRGAGASPEAGWRTVELLDAAYRSAERDGAAVTVASLYDPRIDANKGE